MHTTSPDISFSIQYTEENGLQIGLMEMNVNKFPVATILWRRFKFKTELSVISILNGFNKQNARNFLNELKIQAHGADTQRICGELQTTNAANCIIVSEVFKENGYEVTDIGDFKLEIYYELK